MPFREFPAPGVIRHQMYWSWDQGGGVRYDITNVIHVLHGMSEPGAAAAQADRDAIRGWMSGGPTTGWRNIGSPRAKPHRIRSAGMWAVPPVKLGDERFDGSVGAGTRDDRPPLVTAVCSLRTANPKARKNGRMYVCGVREDVTVGGVWTANAMLALRDAGLSLRQALIDGPGAGELAVVGWRTGGVVTNPPDIFVVNDVLVGPRLAVQRRRRPRQRGYFEIP